MVSIENLSFAFRKNQPLFHDLSLQLETGHTYGLFGLNGAGKTTLLNHLCGMLFPDSGSCKIAGHESRKRLPETLSELYLLPEQFELPKVNADVYARIHAPFYARFNHSTLNGLLDEFEVNREKKLPELSYGQRKKFLVAFSLATHAKVVLMDEPTNGMDIPSKSQFRKIMAATDQSERCVLISTHQVRDLDALIDTVIVLSDGRILFQQQVEEISKRLSFEKIPEGDDRPAIYSEDVFGGRAAILPKHEKSKETQIDLELLFNGVIREPEQMNRQFSNRNA